MPEQKLLLMPLSSLPALRHTTNTSKQGVYIGIPVRLMPSPSSNTNGKYFWLYTGSGYGNRGIGKRITENHLNEAFRNRNASELYRVLKRPDVQANFLALAIFEQQVSVAEVLIAEAVFTHIFGSYKQRLYIMTRPEGLPGFRPELCLNRQSPLLGDDGQAMMIDLNRQRRASVLSRIMTSEEFSVTHKYDAKRKADQYNWSFMTVGFFIPVRIAREWGLDKSPTVNVLMEAFDGPHPHQYAKFAPLADSAARLGIMLSKDLEEKPSQKWWVEGLNASNVLYARSLVDLVTGVVVDTQNHTWPSDRFPWGSPKLTTKGFKVRSFETSTWFKQMKADYTSRKVLTEKSANAAVPTKRLREDDDGKPSIRNDGSSKSICENIRTPTPSLRNGSLLNYFSVSK